jgi:hypothetical protein
MSSIVGQKINDPASIMIATARANATAAINSGTREHKYWEFTLVDEPRRRKSCVCEARILLALLTRYICADGMRQCKIVGGSSPSMTGSRCVNRPLTSV